MESPKTVNQVKLNGLTDSQLIERIQKAPLKIEAKKIQILAKIKELEQQLSAYTKYRTDDLSAAKQILEQRQKTKTALPGGVAPKGNPVKPEGIKAA